MQLDRARLDAICRLEMGAEFAFDAAVGAFRRQDDLRGLPIFEGLSKFPLRTDGIARLQQSAAQKQSNFSVGRILLQRIPKLNDRPLVIAFGLVRTRRCDQGFGTLATCQQQQRRCGYERKRWPAPASACKK